MRIIIDIRETGTKYDFKDMRDFTGDLKKLLSFTQIAVDEILIEARRLQDEANATTDTAPNGEET